MTKRAAFTQADLERAMRAAKAVGCEHPTVDIWPDGRIRLLTNPPPPEEPASDLAAWRRKRGERAA